MCKCKLNPNPNPITQVLAFIEEVISEPVYVAGNSLGGYIGAHLAANHPRSVLGLALLNATPFWAFRRPTARRGDGSEISPTTSSSVTTEPAKISAVDDRGVVGTGGGGWLGWDGILPAPAGLFRFGAWYFDRMRDPRTVKSMLASVYSNPGKVMVDMGGGSSNYFVTVLMIRL